MRTTPLIPQTFPVKLQLEVLFPRSSDDLTMPHLRRSHHSMKGAIPKMGMCICASFLYTCQEVVYISDELQQ